MADNINHMKLGIFENMAALSAIYNEVNRVQQKVKQQHLTLMDMLKRWTRLIFSII
jgi:hypothetical protein